MSSYLLKITLRGTPNLVWRRFVVPSFTSLSRLHDIVQDVMGWQHEHSHVFYFRKQEYAPTSMEGRPCSKNAAADAGTLPEEPFSLDDLVFQAGAKLKYLYDPEGDKWMHDITVESIRYVDTRWSCSIYCFEGVRACPPENCGGTDGYGELLKALKNPKHPRYAECAAHFGAFDPELFSLEQVNKRLKVKGPVDRAGNVALPAPKKERPSKEKTDPLQLLGRRLKKKAAS